MKTIPKGKIMSRRTTITIRDLQEATAIAQQAQKQLAVFGYGIYLVPIGEMEDTPTRSGRPSQKIGIKKYWKECKAIAEAEGIGISQARKLYAKRSDTAEMPNRSKTKRGSEFSSKMKKQQRKYWRNVKKIAEEAGVGIGEARKIYKQRKSVA